MIHLSASWPCIGSQIQNISVTLVFDKFNGHQMVLMHGCQTQLKPHVDLTLGPFDWQIKPKDRIIIIGPNGAGKSTFLKHLIGQIEADGDTHRKQNLTIGYLPQDIPIGDDHHTLDQCLAIAEDDHQQLANRHKYLQRFGLNDTQLWGSLSGGQKRIVLLIKSLLDQPDCLCLDEPTNHLDLQAIDALVDLIQHYTGALVMISHDRWLMDQVGQVLWVFQPPVPYFFQGNYSEYLDFAEQQASAQAHEKQKMAQHLKAEQRWLARGVTARRKRNQGRLEKLNTLKTQYQAMQKTQQSLTIEQPEATQVNKKLLSLQTQAIELSGKAIVQQVNLTIYRGEKIGLVGANGSGKTTLIKALLGEMPSALPQMPKVLSIGYFDQHRQSLNPQSTALDEVAGGRTHISINGKNQHAYGYLKQFKIDQRLANAPIATLSLGEQNRVLLAKILSVPVDLLILDEPTNDLDIETLTELEIWLSEYTGTLIITSHDRTFLHQIIDRTWLIDQGKIEDYAGGLITRLPNRPQTTKNTIKKVSPKKTSNKLSNKERQQLATLPEQITQLEIERDQLLQKFQEKLPANDFIQLQKDCQTLETQIEDAYQRWQQLEEKQANQ
jgi:ATP-binding cassette subfamily F protein uup